jgi:hypothetical protein
MDWTILYVDIVEMRREEEEEEETGEKKNISEKL